MIDVDPDSACAVGSAEYPTEPTKTSTGPTTWALANFEATQLTEFILCQGEKLIAAPPTPYHVFYLEDFSYGVSKLNSKFKFLVSFVIFCAFNCNIDLFLKLPVRL